jgi:hypothetical protein
MLSLAAGGCVSSMMRPVGPETTYEPAAGKAVIIFMRPSTLGYAIQSSVFDLAPNKETVTVPFGAGDQFVGIVSSTAKVAYVTEPGEHLFMVIGENADFMKATLVEGKTHYALVSPRMGWWKARFSLEPVRADTIGSEDFEDWYSSTDFIENTEESHAWAKDNWESIQDKKTDYIRKWLGKPQEERDEQTLLPVDCR